MEYRLLSTEEDLAFTKLVIEYNKLRENKEDEVKLIALENRIKARTSLLLYMIPMYSLYLEEEEAGGFFLDIQKDIDWIISSFRLSGLSYNKYLAQICRYRVTRYTKRNQKNKALDAALSFSDVTVYEKPLSEKCVPYCTEAKDVSEMNLAEVSNHIIHFQSEKLMALTEEEENLSILLRKTRKRRQFLSFLLSLPETETPGFIAGVSRLLRNDISVISRFYTLRHEYLYEANGSTIERLELTAARHWKIMAKLRRAIWFEEDAERKSLLLGKYHRLSDIYRMRRAEIAKAHNGLTQKEISDILGISRSSVSHDINEMRKSLKMISSPI